MKKVSKDTLAKWQERVNRIRSNHFAIAESHEDKLRRINRARKDYPYFVSQYFPHIAPKPTAAFQTRAANYIAENRSARALFEWARGHAKSTHLSCLIPLWLLAKNPGEFRNMVLVGKSEEDAKALLGNLQAELANNKRYQDDFEINAGQGTQWQDGRFVSNTDTLFVAKGRGQSPRGMNYHGHRPDYIVIDDIDDDELCRNPARVGKVYDWLMSALFGTMEAGRGRFIMVGNRIAKTSVLSRFAATPNIFHTTINILDKNGEPSWHQNYTTAEVQEMRTTMGERAFMREFMNAPSTEGTVFRSEWIRPTAPLPLRKYRQIVCYTDPSWRSGKSNDYKATVVVGKTPAGTYHILNCYAAQTTVKDMVAWHYSIEEEARKAGAHIRFYMEAGFVQDLLLDEFKKEGALRELQLAITPDKRHKPDKFARIEALQPLFERALILFNERTINSPGMQTLIEQLLCIEPGSRAHDDAPDALEGAVFKLGRSGFNPQSVYAVSTKTDRHY